MVMPITDYYLLGAYFGAHDGEKSAEFEEFMGETENANSQPRFTRRSDTESICTFCSVSIRVNRYTVLEEAEDIHADVCLVNPDYCVRYVLL